MDLDALLDRFRLVRWLEPDPELGVVSPEARRWLEDRADELLASLEPYVYAHLAPSTLSVEVERDGAAAFSRWTDAWAEALTADPFGPGSELVTALGRAAVKGLPASGFGLSRDDLHTQLSNWGRDALRRSSTWRRAIPLNERPPGETALRRHVGWVIENPEQPPARSPWSPLLAMWERGAWPLLLPGATLLVWIPATRGGAIEADAEAAAAGRSFILREFLDARRAGFRETHEEFCRRLGLAPSPGFARGVPQAWLRVIDGAPPGVFIIPLPSTRLGRVRDDGNRSNEVVLNDSTVSRFHAQIDLANGAWVINDRQSNNGVWVNDARVTEQRLASGDVVRMGGVLLRFETLDGR